MAETDRPFPPHLTPAQNLRKEAYICALQLYAATNNQAVKGEEAEEKILDLTDRFYEYLNKQDQ